MNAYVVPEPSERCTGVMFMLGRSSFVFSAWICGSFHFVIEPSKMPTIVAELSRSRPLTPGTL